MLLIIAPDAVDAVRRGLCDLLLGPPPAAISEALAAGLGWPSAAAMAVDLDNISALDRADTSIGVLRGMDEVAFGRRLQELTGRPVTIPSPLLRVAVREVADHLVGENHVEGLLVALALEASWFRDAVGGTIAVDGLSLDISHIVDNEFDVDAYLGVKPSMTVWGGAADGDRFTEGDLETLWSIARRFDRRRIKDYQPEDPRLAEPPLARSRVSHWGRVVSVWPHAVVTRGLHLNGNVVTTTRRIDPVTAAELAEAMAEFPAYDERRSAAALRFLEEMPTAGLRQAEEPRLPGMGC